MTRGVDRRPLVDVLIFERAAPTGARLHPPRPTRSVQLQAAIQAVHCAADTFQASDWPQIVALYDQLFSVMPTPVVALNRAIAVVEIEGPAAALTTLDAIAPDLDTCHLMHCSPRHDVASARTTRRRGGSVRTRRPPRSDRKGPSVARPTDRGVGR
jgi:predicted RNA polymerase sigma factor